MTDREGSRLQTLLQSRAVPGAVAVATGSVLLLLAMSRAWLDHAPLYDELLHVLSARGLNATGQLAIADGLYTRASGFTRLVAWSMRNFGSDLPAARLPSLVGTALLLALVAAWTVRRAGLAAGVVAALVLCLLPETLQLAVFVRFYTLHAAVIAAIAVLAWAAGARGRPTSRRVLAGTAALLLLPVGWHLQPSTAIAAAAILAATAAVVAFDHWSTLGPFVRRNAMLCVVLAIAVVAGGLWIASRLGLLSMLREVPVWAAWAADKKLYYVQRLAGELPLLWPLFPVAAIVAWRTSPRLALFCLVLSGSGLLVHSIAAAKQVRYVYYLLPFVAVIGGLAVQAVLVSARDTRRIIGVACVFVAVLLLSREGQLLSRVIIGRMAPVEALPYLVEPDWTRAEVDLRSEAGSADRIVTSNAMKALYHLGRSDIELNASIVPETDGAAEFGRDPRTGRPAISTAASLERVIDAPGVTLVILEAESMNRETHVPSATVALLDARCAAVSAGADVGLRSWRCGSSR